MKARDGRELAIGVEDKLPACWCMHTIEMVRERERERERER